MQTASSSSAKTFALCTVILYVKFLVTARMQALRTFAAGGRPPEDNKLAKLTKREGPTQNYGLLIDMPTTEGGDAATEDAKKSAHLLALKNDQRWKRIVANDVESIPLALLVFGAGLIVESQEGVQCGAMIVFTLARLVHTYVYAKSIQPWRSLVWCISVVAVLTAAINIVVSVFAK